VQGMCGDTFLSYPLDLTTITKNRRSKAKREEEYFEDEEEEDEGDARPARRSKLRR